MHFKTVLHKQTQLLKKSCITFPFIRGFYFLLFFFLWERKFLSSELFYSFMCNTTPLLFAIWNPPYGVQLGSNSVVPFQMLPTFIEFYKIKWTSFCLKWCSWSHWSSWFIVALLVILLRLSKCRPYARRWIPVNTVTKWHNKPTPQKISSKIKVQYLNWTSYFLNKWEETILPDFTVSKLCEYRCF